MIPPAPSRARSRRCRSCVVSNVSSASNVAGSATQCSEPAETSSTHSALALSVPLALRAKTMREPSGEISRLRGSPNVKRWVRAKRRGNDSLVIGPNYFCGSTSILACCSGLPKSIKACGTPSIPTLPVSIGDRSTSPWAMA